MNIPSVQTDRAAMFILGNDLGIGEIEVFAVIFVALDLAISYPSCYPGSFVASSDCPISRIIA